MKAVEAIESALRERFQYIDIGLHDDEQWTEVSITAYNAVVNALYPGEAVRAAYPWRTNADLIYDVWRMGHIKGMVFDATPGNDALWWRRLTTEPTYAKGIKHITLNGLSDGPRRDFRETWYPDNTFDTVAFDPPYKFNGNPKGLPELSSRYGVDIPTRWQLRMEMMVEGLLECLRITAPGGKVLVKCQDQVVSGAIRWQTRTLADAAEGRLDGQEIPNGWRYYPKGKQVDRFDMLGHHIPQPMEGRTQKHAHARPSTLLVFERLGKDS